jgi:hypothetical protein
MILQRFSSTMTKVTDEFRRTPHNSVHFMEYLIGKLFQYEECDWTFVACILAIFDAIIVEEHRLAEEMNNVDCYVCCIQKRLLYPMNLIIDDMSSWTYNHGGWGQISLIHEVENAHFTKTLAKIMEHVDVIANY